MKKPSDNKTPLAMAIANHSRPPATPIEVFKLARKTWLQGKRVSIGDLAKEVGVSRGTLYRWVGSKELLLDEIFWSLIKPAFENAVAETPGHGVEHVVAVHRRFMIDMLSFLPLQKFIADDPNYSLRVLTDLSSGVSERMVKLTAEHLRSQELNGYLRLHSTPEKLAEIFILANTAIIYSDAISGRSPAIEKACSLIQMLLSSSQTVETQAASATAKKAVED
ncbi:MAG: TetR family transcriptional regulator [Desulfobacterales bacterium]|nr:TetR family transcriptional regulator [Desulfobacterales bacterium]